MAYKPGHLYHPPRNGKRPGGSPAVRAANRMLSLDIRENVPAAAIREIHVSVLMGYTPHLLRQGEEPAPGMRHVAWDKDAAMTTLDQRLNSAARLENRAWGTPAMEINLNNELRMQITASADPTVLEGMTGADLAQLAGILGRRRLSSSPADSTAGSVESATTTTSESGPAIDAEFVDKPDDDT